jgi:hypothetical protein
VFLDPFTLSTKRGDVSSGSVDHPNDWLNAESSGECSGPGPGTRLSEAGHIHVRIR